MTSIEDENTRARALGPVANEWMDHNPLEASEWIATLENGKARDEAVEELVNHIYRSDPVSALAWAFSADSSSKRKSMVRRAVDHLKRSGKSDVALREIENSGLVEEDKQYLLNRLYDIK